MFTKDIFEYKYTSMNTSPVYAIKSPSPEVSSCPNYLLLLYFVIRTLKIYPLSKFLIIQYSIVNYSHYAIQSISRSYSFCITETLYPLTNTSLFPPPLNPWQPPFYSLLL